MVPRPARRVERDDRLRRRRRAAADRPAARRRRSSAARSAARTRAACARSSRARRTRSSSRRASARSPATVLVLNAAALPPPAGAVAAAAARRAARVGEGAARSARPSASPTPDGSTLLVANLHATALPARRAARRRGAPARRRLRRRARAPDRASPSSPATSTSAPRRSWTLRDLTGPEWGFSAPGRRRRPRARARRRRRARSSAGRTSGGGSAARCSRITRRSRCGSDDVRGGPPRVPGARAARVPERRHVRAAAARRRTRRCRSAQRQELELGRGALPAFEAMLALRERVRGQIAALLGVGTEQRRADALDDRRLQRGARRPRARAGRRDRDHRPRALRPARSARRVGRAHRDRRRPRPARRRRARAAARRGHAAHAPDRRPARLVDDRARAPARRAARAHRAAGARRRRAVGGRDPRRRAATFDFFTVSAQKWLCGPDGTGALVVARPEELRVGIPSYFAQTSFEPGGAFTPQGGRGALRLPRADAGARRSRRGARAASRVGVRPRRRARRRCAASASRSTSRS